MQKFVSTKALYGNFKKISDQVQQGTVFIVLKHSQPVYKIVPLEQQDLVVDLGKGKKHKIDEIKNFTFESKNKEKNLATDFKKYIYY